LKLTLKTHLACLALGAIGGGLGSLSLPAYAQGKSGTQTQASAPDLSSPQKTIESFAAAIKRGDMEAARKCVLNGKPIPFPGPAGTSGPVITLSETHYKTEGDRATYTGKDSITMQGNANSYPIEEKLELKKVGPEWKIVAPDKLARGYLTTFATMIGHPELYNASRSKAQEISCLSNMRQIGLGCLMFLQDHEEKFALNAETYKKSVMPYIKNEQIFHCPLDKPGVVSYAFNSSLAGVALGKIQAPAQTIMLYEGKDGKLLFRHAGKAGVVFVDGHAKMMTQEQVKSLRWKP
jgi:prepilin-type processing-associated H-X9-DG protein